MIEEWGADLQSEHERYLVEKHFKKPVILFDYPKDIDGKSQNAASKALMRHIAKVRTSEDQNLVVHSLRHTYKDMLRDAGIAKDMQDFLLGHAASSVGESYGQGYSLKSKKEAIDRLNLSFLASTD